MKFMILFMVIATLNATAKIYSQYAKVTLNIDRGTIEDVFKEIEKQSDFNIFYKVDQLNTEKKISVVAKDKLLSEVLDNLLNEYKATYAVLDKIIVIKGTEGNAKQSTEISGTITDSVTGEPLPGVNILIKGTGTGTVTDMNGTFALKSDEADITLVISFIGYIQKEVKATTGTPMQISLDPDILGLEEVVVIGYGVEKKSLVTGAISKIRSDEIENTSVANAEQALQGRTAGVHVLSTSGAPGSAMKIRIRGAGSNGNSQPLFIVDGVKTNNINLLNPNDIESMEVLKDAASSAIYGAEGANGVVIITTKSGKAGTSKVEYSFQYGIQSQGNLPELMNADQYIDFMNDGILPGASASGYDTDWLDEIFENAPMQKHNVSISGGNESTTFYSTLSYHNQDGILGGDKANFQRVSGRLNVNQRVNNMLKVGSKIAYSNTNRKGLPEDSEFDGVLSGALGIDPLTAPYYNSISNMPQTVQDKVDGQPVRQAEDGRYFGISQYVEGEIVNPLLRLDISNENTITDNIMGNFYAEITPLKNLVFTSRVGVDYTHENLHDWKPTYYYSSERNNGATSVIDEGFSENRWQWENFATFNKQVASNNIAVVAGMSAESRIHRVTRAQKDNMYVEDDLYDEINYTASPFGLVEGNVFEEKVLSYFGRASYNFKERYMLQASLRYDGASTSLLPAGENWGAFPSFSAGWVISEESFFPREIISFMKLRGSWGQNGNLGNLRNVWADYPQFSPFEFITQFAYLDAVVNEGIRYPLPGGGYITASEPAYLPNPALTWETSQQTDVGIDLRFLGGKLSFTADYYIKQTKDLLALVSAPATAGNTAPFINAGEVENKGFEFDFSFRDFDGEFKYQLNANLSTQKNEVTALNLDAARLRGMRIGPSWLGATAFEVGEPVWYFRGYKTDGFDSSGNPNFVDISGPDGEKDGRITDDDLTNIGSPHPSLIYGGGLNLEYKGIDFNIFVQGVAGNEVVMGWIRSDRLMVNRPTIFYDNPAMRMAAPDGKTYQSDLLVFDGSYTRIKQIQLGYTLPSSLVNMARIKNLRLYASLDDFFTFTKYEGMDPEAGSSEDSSLGIDRGVYPIARKVMFGINVSF